MCPPSAWRVSTYAFFFKKKESLAQDLAGSFISAIFSGIIVAVAAVLIMGEVKHVVDVSEKRAAVANFQNRVVSKTLQDVTVAYTGLDCAHDHALLLRNDCKNQLSSIILLLRQRMYLLNAFGMEKINEPMKKVIVSAEKAYKVSDKPTLRAQGETIIRDLSRRFFKMISIIAKEHK